MTRLLRPLRALLALLACLLAATATARAEQLVTSLSSHQVQITSTYVGTQVVLFGAVRRDAQTIARSGPYHAAIVVRGPPQTLTVRLRERRGPIWINGEQQKFAQVPAYYAVLSSAPIEDITTPPVRERLRLGLRALAENPGATVEREGREAVFQEALVRLRARAGLYRENPRGVTFLRPDIFRAAISVPADAPPGNYEVEVLLFADGILLARDITAFELVKTGVEQRIADAAETQPLAYGLATGMLAILLGWLASVVFRRD